MKEGFARGIFGEVSHEEVFKDSNGKPVLNGAMGVDKFKVAEGKSRTFMIHLYPCSHELVP